jgi:hypothetical protein
MKNSTSTTGRPLLTLVGEPAPGTRPPISPLERRHGLGDERSRVLALAVAVHLPVELAIRAADLTAQLQRTP